jgi:hypothetical protein
MYDSAPDTIKHIARVKHFIGAIAHELTKRGVQHDASKLQSPEKETFDELTPKLKELKYDSPEYRESLKELGTALEHHYNANSHHPEHYENGIDDMNLLDIVEMFCDWAAATERTKDGNLEVSIEKNKIRFGMSDQLVNIFRNSIELLKDNNK